MTEPRHDRRSGLDLDRIARPAGSRRRGGPDPGLGEGRDRARVDADDRALGRQPEVEARGLGADERSRGPRAVGSLDGRCLREQASRAGRRHAWIWRSKSSTRSRSRPPRSAAVRSPTPGRSATPCGCPRSSRSRWSPTCALGVLLLRHDDDGVPGDVARHPDRLNGDLGGRGDDHELAVDDPDVGRRKGDRGEGREVLDLDCVLRSSRSGSFTRPVLRLENVTLPVASVAILTLVAANVSVASSSKVSAPGRDPSRLLVSAP